MATLAKDSETQSAVSPSLKPHWVRVVVLGGPVRQIEHRVGMTVGDVLEECELSGREGEMLHLNGQPAERGDVVEPDSDLQVTQKVRNG